MNVAPVCREQQKTGTFLQLNSSSDEGYGEGQGLRKQVISEEPFLRKEHVG